MNFLTKTKNFVRGNSAILIPVWLIVTLLAAAYVNSSLTNLPDKSADLKFLDVVSLQLAYSDEKAQMILSEWSVSQQTAVLKSIDRDIWFIFAYVILLLLLLTKKKHVVIRWKEKQWDVRGLLLVLVPLAAFCDGIENFFMTRYLESTYEGVELFLVPASIKFGLLILTALVLLGPLSEKLALLRETLQLIRTYFVGIASVAFIYFILIKLTQGQDVVIQTAEFIGPLIYTSACLIFWAVVTWYSSRLVSYVKHDSIRKGTWLWCKENVPRVLAFNTFVSVQAAILALPSLFSLDQFQLVVFIMIQNMLYFFGANLISAWREGKKNIAFKTKVRWGYLIIFTFVSAAYVYGLLSLVGGKTYATRLAWLALALYVLQFVGLFLSIERRRNIKRGINSKEGKSKQEKEGLIKALPVSDKVKSEERTSFFVFHVIVVIAIIFYLLAFNLKFIDRMGSLAVIFLSFGMIVGTANIFTVISIVKKINLFFYLFVWIILVGSCNDPYAIRVKEANDGSFYINRPTVKTFLKNWIDHPDRKRMIEEYNLENCKFPAYLVIADGGASRSGYWVASVLSALQDSSNWNDRFSNHLFCLAGASGGSVGNATFYSLLAKDYKGKFLPQSKNFLRQDFLSPVLFRWLGTDVVKHVLPFLPIDDRAAALENAMEYFECDVLNSDVFSKRYSEVVDVSGKLPLLFINVTQVQSGQPSLISPVRLDFSDRLDVLDRIRKHHKDTVSGDLNFSTAVVMGARFPYVSPGGSIGDDFFVDGGYFDNTGAGIVLEMMQHLKGMDSRGAPIDTATNALLNKLDFRLIFLSNSSELEKPEPLSRLTNDLAAPLLTVLGTYGSQTAVGNKRLINTIDNSDSTRYFEFNLIQKCDKLDYPMNWVISDFNLERMDDRLKEVKQQREFQRAIRYRQ